MNIPLGKQELGKKLDAQNVLRDVRAFLDRMTSGYLCIMIKGKAGFEEGLLLMDGSQIIGAHYAFLKYDKEFVAGEAVKRVANAFLAPVGYYEVYSLNTQQVELLKMFNEDLLLLEGIQGRSFEGSIPVAFSEEFENQVVQEASPEGLSTEQVLKKRNLGEIKIDSYQEINKALQAEPKAELPEKVAEEVGAYISGKPVRGAEPTAEPEIKEAPIAAAKKTPAEEFSPELKDVQSPEFMLNLDLQAEKLKRLMLKEGKQ